MNQFILCAPNAGNLNSQDFPPPDFLLPDGFPLGDEPWTLPVFPSGDEPWTLPEFPPVLDDIDESDFRDFLEAFGIEVGEDISEFTNVNYVIENVPFALAIAFSIDEDLELYISNADGNENRIIDFGGIEEVSYIQLVCDVECTPIEDISQPRSESAYTIFVYDENVITLCSTNPNCDEPSEADVVFISVCAVAVGCEDGTEPLIGSNGSPTSVVGFRVANERPNAR